MNQLEEIFELGGDECTPNKRKRIPLLVLYENEKSRPELNQGLLSL